MRRRASSEGRVFVRQNLEKGQLTVDDTGFNAKRYSHSKVYDVGLRDMHWQDLHNLMPNGKNSVNTETVQEAARRRLLIPKWGLVDWWYRFEWQHHDSLVTTINPDLNALPSDHHQCQKHSEDFNDNNGYLTYLELTTARNDPLINPHDRIQLQGWRANVDLIPILTKQYVSSMLVKQNHGA
uniref:Uncharacterized protein n=1 Tax=Rhizophagus irregularis (strain DAOM 181602 / DAOM 197198 / MUCL 43194) TaxID=747089 RepID=U9SSL0_RHIID